MRHSEDIAQKFEHYCKAIQQTDFLKMNALGGEIPFYIAPYLPEQELEVSKAIEGLFNRLENKGINIINVDLYAICVEILDRELGEGEIFELETQMDKEAFKDALQSVLDMHEVLMPHIKQKIETARAKVYFVTGIGKVFPFIRSHNVLNNLQSIATDAPTVLFFPGIYTGQSLQLFGKLKDDNYYRAFNLDNYKL